MQNENNGYECLLCLIQEKGKESQNAILWVQRNKEETFSFSIPRVTDVLTPPLKRAELIAACGEALAILEHGQVFIGDRGILVLQRIGLHEVFYFAACEIEELPTSGEYKVIEPLTNGAAAGIKSQYTLVSEAAKAAHVLMSFPPPELVAYIAELFPCYDIDVETGSSITVAYVKPQDKNTMEAKFNNFGIPTQAIRVGYYYSIIATQVEEY